MIALDQFAFLRPWWLLALPIVLVFYLGSRPRGGALAAWETASDPHLLAAMTKRGVTTIGTRAQVSAVLLTLVVGILALAGPAIRRQDRDRLRNLDATVIVVDVSQGMGRKGRLRDAANAAHDLLSHLKSRQVGLIVYAGDAYVASALTDFTNAIDTDLFALDDETVPDPGVRPDRALALAGRMLDEAHIINGDVILITSGGGTEGTAGIRAAADLAARKHRIFVMASSGMDKRTDAAVATMAGAGDGFSVDIMHPSRLLETLEAEGIGRTGSSVVTALKWHDLGRLVLGLAAIPLLLGFRKSATA